MRALQSELLRLRTMPVWHRSIFALGGLGLLAGLWVCFQIQPFLSSFDSYLAQTILRPVADMEPGQVERMRAIYVEQSDPDRILAAVYTAGGFIGMAVVAVLGAVLATQGTQHGTDAADFLVEPRRWVVVVARFGAVTALATLGWLATTLGNVIVGVPFLLSQGEAFAPTLPVAGAVLAGWLAFLLWSILGFGVGVIVGRQAAGVAAILISYLSTSVVVGLVSSIIHDFFVKEDWVLQIQVFWPGIASQIMTTPGELFPGAPSAWVGALVLTLYGILASGLGAALLTRRDVV
jgi:ABC-2 type transport system permease protein